MQDDRKTEKGPVSEIQRGWIKAAIWRNVNKDNVTVYSVTLSRSYRDSAGAYAQTNSYSGDELLVVAEVARTAWNQVAKLRRQDWEEKQAARAAPPPRTAPPLTDEEQAAADEVPF